MPVTRGDGQLLNGIAACLTGPVVAVDGDFITVRPTVKQR